MLITMVNLPFVHKIIGTHQMKLLYSSNILVLLKYTQISNIRTLKLIYFKNPQHLLKRVPLTTIKAVHGALKRGSAKTTRPVV